MSNEPDEDSSPDDQLEHSILVDVDGYAAVSVRVVAGALPLRSGLVPEPVDFTSGVIYYLYLFFAGLFIGGWKVGVVTVRKPRRWFAGRQVVLSERFDTREEATSRAKAIAEGIAASGQLPSASAT